MNTGEKVLKIKLKGEIDQGCVDTLRRDIDKAIDDFKGRKIVVDLSHVTFMDSTGVGLLLGRYKKALEYGCNIYLRGATLNVDKVLKLSGIYQLMPKSEE